jgi:UDP-2,4-diacetamido-2,4,6-trideoxy-beta-L-altropyranose hydrolase
MKVFIITEGSRNIGFGHITRCSSLYQAFEEKGVLPIFLIHGDETVKDLLNNKNHDIINWLIEEEKLLTFIEYADVVIIDSYLANYEIYEKVSNLVKVPVYIDDNKRIDYPGGFVVNGSVYADELNYPIRKEVNYLLGSQYIPIRKEFRDVPDKEIKENIKTIMVTFGGDDARNMTPIILNLVKENFPALTKKVIIGKGFRNTEQIESLKDEKTDLIYYPDAAGMKRAMLESDVAISASGQTLYELARVGLPTISIAVADNQMNNVRGWQKAGFVEYAGPWNGDSVFTNVIQKLELLQDNVLRYEKSKRGRALVDGLGAIRIVSHCIKTFFDKSICLRKAEIKDMDKTYELSNDSEVRKYSFHTDRIDTETHNKWYANKIDNPNCLLLIAEINNRFLGQLRFEKENSHAIISISIASEYRHLGLGRLMFQKGLFNLKTYYPNLKYIAAFVKIDNDVSKAFFENLNFRYAGKKIIKNQDAIEYRFDLKEPY